MLIVIEEVVRGCHAPFVVAVFWPRCGLVSWLPRIAPKPASVVQIDRATQTMEVSLDGAPPLFVESIDRPAGLQNAGGHLPSANAGRALVLTRL